MRHGNFSLMDCLNEIDDPRGASNGTLYDFREMLVIAICASLCDMDTCEDFVLWAKARQSWLQRFFDAEEWDTVLGHVLSTVSQS